MTSILGDRQIKKARPKDDSIGVVGGVYDPSHEGGTDLWTDLERLALENKVKQTDRISAHVKGHTYVQANDGVEVSQVARIDDKSAEVDIP